LAKDRIRLKPMVMVIGPLFDKVRVVKQFCYIIATSAQFVFLAVFVMNRHNYACLHRKQKSLCWDNRFSFVS